MTDAAAEIRRLVVELNQTWREGRFADLARFYHPDVVVAHPRFAGRTVGRDAVVASYEQFVASARIHELTMGDVQVDLLPGSAVAAVPWTMKYEFESTTYDESGWDLMVFSPDGGTWRVVWRMLIVDPSPSGMKN